MLNNGKVVTLGNEEKDQQLMACDKSIIANVDKNTLQKAKMEGTVKLVDGSDPRPGTYNLGNNNNCFEKVESEWGISSDGNPLVPFVSVAANGCALEGTSIYFSELEKLILPNGMRHNGCVRIDDNGWSFGDCQIDFMVGTYDNYYYLQNNPDSGYAKGFPDNFVIGHVGCEVGIYDLPQF
ncbi:hypothetical protein HK096_001549 [Nowakowskiella sp. JEL0078]|nr:hypothetical protein HK096_001549 [Nowakowskiella sp. JEL0078]